MNLQRIKDSPAWRPVSFLYRKSGLKAKAYSRSLTPPVKTVPLADFLKRFGFYSSNPPAPACFDIELPFQITSGPMPREDTVAMTHLLRHLQPGRIFEFGTNWGFSTAMFTLNSPPDARIWTLDICQEFFSPEAVAADPELKMVLARDQVGYACKQLHLPAGKVTQIFQDSLKLEWDNAVFPEVFDLIFIDACHKYDFVKSDTEKALQRLRPGGVIVWHDYYTDVGAWPDVFKYVNEFAKLHHGTYHLDGTHLAIWVSA